MERVVDIVLSPVEAADPVLVRQAAEEAAAMMRGTALSARILKRSIDARSKQPRIRLRVAVSDAVLADERIEAPTLRDVSAAPPVIIVGAGPAGLFCAIRCIEHGMRPIVLERGKDVRARRRDLAAISKEHIVDPDSNYCFGEGGAGTFSDGKLYTRSHKRGDVEGVLRLFVAFGASPDILVDAHPHIGTNKLPGIITAMRQAILSAGGEVRLNSRVTGLMIERGAMKGVLLRDGGAIEADRVVLATGHSARDVFELLRSQGIRIERKDFALGVRVEHPQAIIDRAQYHCDPRGPCLPPATYSLVQQVEGLGVYSFCMCPGGIIAPCATAQEEVVTNGWSPSKRDNPFANSGVVVTISPETARSLKHDPSDPLWGVRYQQRAEHAAWQAGGCRQSAPAQRLEDFIQARGSASLPECSYLPGIVPWRVDELLPPEAALRLREGFKAFGTKLRGYRTNEAVVVAVESRTSSPVRVPRDAITLQHADARGLYPCGEGAGHAGGIVSAAMDGQRVADAIATSYADRA